MFTSVTTCLPNVEFTGFTGFTSVVYRIYRIYRIYLTCLPDLPPSCLPDLPQVFVTCLPDLPPSCLPDPKLQTLACHFKGQGSLCVLGGSWFLGGVVVGTHRTRRNTLKLHGIVVPKNILGPTHPSELWSFPNGSGGTPKLKQVGFWAHEMVR